MIQHRFCLSVALVWVAGLAWADARVSVLMDLLRIDDVVQIMREEGLTYAQELDADMLGGQGGAFWSAQVDRIYDTQRMAEVVRRGLEADLDPGALDEATLFFSSQTGSRIVELENAARRAMIDEAVDAAAREMYQQRLEDDGPLLDHVREFAEVNGLVRRNLSEAMGATLQFYRGLSDGGFAPMSEDEMLADVWGQQEDMQAETEEWLFAYLLLAYQPLPPEDFEDYITFSKTDTGRALNRALFAGYGQMYRDISYALGRAISLARSGSEL